MRNISKIIVHCSATPAGREVSVEDITAWHKARGFTTIGYHFVIGLDGSRHQGRPLNHKGAHCLNHNSDSIGICYVGGLAKDGKTPMDTRTPQQKTALVNLLKESKRQFPKAKIYGHCDFAAKACPCFNAKSQ